MKKLLLLLWGSMLLHTALSAQHIRKCGMQRKHEAMIAKNPDYARFLANQKASLQAAGDYYKQYKLHATTERSTALSAVPVIFHIIVDSAQFYNMGGASGIIRRCDSQIAVLNADFNKQNADSALIPSGWKPLYGNVGIHFGLAHRDPSGNCSPGYEVRILPGTSLTTVGYDIDSQPTPAEKMAATGLAAWDVDKYYNVWCINFTGASNGLLGITTTKSDVVAGWSNSWEMGVDILYNTLGSTGFTGSAPGTGGWEAPFNLGRTLTHETGHFFEIWHTWGDDDGLCPWNSGGADDGLNDTPPESDAQYGAPVYTLSGGTLNDGCKMNGSTNTQPVGIACLSYMDYTDDNAMQLFTPDQANVMASMVLVPVGGSGTTAGEGTIGEHYNLTQNPGLLVVCTPSGVEASPTETRSGLRIFPNPTSGVINVAVNSQAEKLIDIVVLDLLGRQVTVAKGESKDQYSLDLGGMSKGIYIVKCNFASGSITRKILLQ